MNKAIAWRWALIVGSSFIVGSTMALITGAYVQHGFLNTASYNALGLLLFTLSVLRWEVEVRNKQTRNEPN